MKPKLTLTKIAMLILLSCLTALAQYSVVFSNDDGVVFTNKIIGYGIECCITNQFKEAYVDVHLDVVTNWTGAQFNGKELGYLATNHIAEIVYQGETNMFTLKTTASEVAKWRAIPKPEPMRGWTNFVPVFPYMVTNQLIGL